MTTKFQIDKNVLTLEVDLSQPKGKLVALGLLEECKHMVIGYFMHLQMQEAQKKQAQFGIIRPNGKVPTNGDVEGHA